MSKKVLKIFSIILIVTVLFSLPTVVFADQKNNNPIIRDTEPGLPGSDNNNQLTKVTNAVIGSMMWIGYACAIGMVVYIGIKYVLASADEKASLKGMLVKVVIGSFIIVLSLQITNLLISILGDSGTSGGSEGTQSEAKDTSEDYYKDVLP